MKRIIIVLLSLVVLAACQPTPDREFVHGDAQIVKNADGADDYSMEIPEKTDEIILENETSRIVIRASIDAGKREGFSVETVEKQPLTDAKFEELIRYFAAGAAVYAQTNERTRDVIEREMRDVMAEMEQMDPNSDDYSGAQDALDALKNEYAAAPDVPEERREIAAKLIPDEANAGGKTFAGWFEREGVRFDCEAVSGSMYNWFTLKCADAARVYPLPESPEVRTPEKTCAETDARTAADAIIRAIAPGMGFEKSECRWDEAVQRNAYAFTYRPAIGGSAVRAPRIVTKSDEIPYAPARWHADRICITVDHDGLVAFSWSDFGTRTGAISENSALLPFSQVLSIAEQQLKNMYAWSEDGTPTEYYVDRIALEYACVLYRDHGDAYLLVPVWNFYGGARSTDPELGTVEQYGYVTDVVHVSVQAIDGKVITE